jgi:hypothetical protein
VTLYEAAAVLALLAALADETSSEAPHAFAELVQGRELDQAARILARWADGNATDSPARSSARPRSSDSEPTGA